MISSRCYTPVVGITEDYHLVRNFFISLGYAEFTYARWDWMITHGILEKEGLGKIKLWFDDQSMVGIATYDTRLGQAYCLTQPAYAFLKKEMLAYARVHLRNSQSNGFSVVIADDDHAFQTAAAHQGFIGTSEFESDAIFYCDQVDEEWFKKETLLPPGYKLVSMAQEYNPYEYRSVLWKGFNHEVNGEGPLVFTPEDQTHVDEEMKRPHVDLNLKLAVVGPDGHFVAYCGMWFDKQVSYGVIEPVATDPDFRRKGLAKALVLEGIRRVASLGAKNVLVGSNQQFYYSIGMRPYKKATVWVEKKQ